ncbi:MAG: nucleotidyl transferase AbiEii/AbiGii toxin family protein [Elusimicrobia bacterium]|nr:nucleotidyl transferase AbiEii/AbiGii toxin family protein [Elusimicrobiota bacterium]
MLKFRPQLIFKGGTSLAKVFRVVDRFSEDVDLSLSRSDLGFGDEHDPEQAGIGKNEARRRLEALVERCRRTIEEKFLPGLRQDFASVLGGSGWSLDLDKDDPQTLVFAYPESDATSKLRYIRPAIRLEMGARSDDWPAVEAELTPYAAEDFPGVFAQPKCLVRTLSAERTFWEKATLLHAECHRPATKATAERHSRHYYDLYCLSRHAIGTEALKRGDLLERVVQHKSFFFASAWADYATAKPGTFRLVPGERALVVLSKDYAEMQAMMFGGSPRWDDIIAELGRLEAQINGTRS